MKLVGVLQARRFNLIKLLRLVVLKCCIKKAKIVQMLPKCHIRQFVYLVSSFLCINLDVPGRGP
jgi:hypothetical protein